MKRPLAILATAAALVSAGAAQSTSSGTSGADRLIPFGTKLDPGAQVLQSRELAKSLAAPRDPQWQAQGDQRRTYRFPGAGVEIPYRLYVPTTWDGKSKLPLVLMLHGAGSNESRYLDQNNKQLLQLAEQHGYLLVSPLGYGPMGAYGTCLRLPAVFGQAEVAAQQRATWCVKDAESLERSVARRVLDRAAKTLMLRVYDVSGVALKTDPASVIRITKPPGVPAQPWDYRRKAATEKQGDVLINESVTLSSSQPVGASKRGNRNIIPITGGELSGRVTGKALAGGADYQNLSNPATIDARYLWQANDGEMILVRNAGPFGALMPTFEARTDGPYAFLNTSLFLSSNPGMAAGGVGITMYDSKN